jgi:two-component system sensor histidine kinase/response regulator
MTLMKHRSPRYLLIYFLPVALSVVIAALFAYSALQQMRGQLETIQQKQLHDTKSLEQANRVSQELDRTHQWALTQLAAAPPHNTAHDAGTTQAQLRQRVDSLESLFHTLKDVEHLGHGPAHIHAVQQDFQAYVQALSLAREHARQRPDSARRYLLEATEHYLHLAALVDDVTASILQEAETTEKAQHALAQRRSYLLGLVGAFTAGTLLLGWYLASRAISRRLVTLSETVRALASGQNHPPQMDQVNALAQKDGGLMAEMARACLAFRDSIAARDRAQYDLTERVKEQSCMYDIFRLTEDESASTAEMLQRIVERLPAAMRFPETTLVHVACFGQSMGSPEALALPHRLQTFFDGDDGAVHQLTVACTAPPVDGSDAFLPEESAMLEAIGLRISSMLQRRRAKALEKDHQTLMNILVEESPVAIELVDVQNLRFVLANATACAQLGYSKDELLAMTLADVQGRFSATEVRDKVDGIVAGGQMARFENKRRRRDGSLLDTETDVHVIERSQRQFMVIIWRDLQNSKPQHGGNTSVLNI